MFILNTINGNIQTLFEAWIEKVLSLFYKIIQEKILDCGLLLLQSVRKLIKYIAYETISTIYQNH